MAGLLWPDSSEERARNNMRQLLRRLRLAAGAELVSGVDVIQLAPVVAADAAELEAHVFAGRNIEALALGGALLGPHDFDDCLEFADWLGRAREDLES
ncbi:MAG: AfsR family transcriptional regulator, partial [Myxococcaceae bacterium]